VSSKRVKRFVIRPSKERVPKRYDAPSFGFSRSPAHTSQLFTGELDGECFIRGAIVTREKYREQFPLPIRQPGATN
jgi:hypothetical protein